MLASRGHYVGKPLHLARFVTPVKTVNSEPNRKYFGSGRGITWYNFVSDQYSGFHDIVVPGTLRDSIFVLEGLLEQQTGLNPVEIMTDTAGTSNIIFGLFWMNWPGDVQICRRQKMSGMR